MVEAHTDTTTGVRSVATIREIKQAVEKLPAEEKARFLREFSDTLERAISNPSIAPEAESRMCYRLGLPTEADKLNQATILATRIMDVLL